MEYLTMNTGARIPMVGFGVFRVPDKKECKDSVLAAIRCGYRLIDTATAYDNEDAVGEAVREAIAEGLCTREELFITSKLWVGDAKNEQTAIDGAKRSLEKLGLEYLDLYLLHQSYNDVFAAWRGLTALYKEGSLRALGISNFYPFMVANFCETVDVQPAVNQIELHPYFVQDDAVENMKYYNVVPEAWAPLGGGRYNPFEEKLLQDIAAAHGKSFGQVILRWNVQRGVVVLPKSVHEERIKENIDIFDFTLDEDEMKKISSFDMGYGDTRTKHFDPEFVKLCMGKPNSFGK